MMRLRLTLAFLVGLLPLLAACAAAPTPSPTSAPTPTPDYVAELERAVERDGIEAVLDPVILDADAVHNAFGPDEPVMVVSVNGVERAYALLDLVESEVINDTLEGIPIAVTW
jgi:hypothetical protein